MKKMLLLALLLVPALALAGGSSSWSLVQSGKDDVDIYKRQLSGDKEPEIKGIGSLPATPDQVLALITDIPKYAKLLHGISKAEVLKTGTNEVYVYFQCDFPWPASDRDYVAHYTWEKKGDGYLVSFVDANYWRPDVPRGMVRIETVRGSWLLEPNADGTSTKATYIFLAEYGGSLPEGIKKDAQIGEQVELFKAVRKSLSKK